MDFLYHGSAFKQDELKPGFHHTGKKTSWDQTESNVWLYATTLRDEAISLGFASAVEKQFDVKRYHTEGDTIHFDIRSGETLQRQDLNEIKVYLYTIQYDKRDGWVKVNNQFNGIDQEYKTTHVIKGNLFNREDIDIAQWLEDKKLTIASESMPIWARW